jgi:thiamine biosynthesis lipoprotein
MAATAWVSKADTELSAVADGFSYAFTAMGSPCEARVDTEDEVLAVRIGRLVEEEARRIEHKFSRYRPDSLLSQINGAAGEPTRLDDETAALIDYTAHFHRLSGGRFDITSGVLRRAWRFDGSDNVPSPTEVRALIPLIGWRRVVWRRPYLTLPLGMEIDLGGIAKEYAVDSALLKAAAATHQPLLVNFGGDLRVTGPRRDGGRWRVAIESVEAEGAIDGRMMILGGALTTSGDARRFLLKDGVRYGHILNPRTGWPVKDAPRSVTVAAPTCIEAGVLSTLAMIHGGRAEAFLKREGVQAWCAR